MFLSRLVYYSRPVSLATHDLRDILTASSANNYLRNITGALYYNGSYFVQVLEGARTELTALFLKISADPRHADVNLMEFTFSSERVFADWDMRYIGANEQQERIIRRFMPAGFDPSVIADSGVMTRLLKAIADQTPPCEPGRLL